MNAGPTYAQRIADWALGLRYEDIPAPLIADAKARVLDTIGNMVAGSTEPLGKAILRAAPAFGTGADAAILPMGLKVPASTAALVNGTFGHALDYDDTHNATLVHPSSPVVATCFALAKTHALDSRALLVAVVMGNEIFCRLGMVAPMAFHRSGIHPTAVLGPTATALVAAKIMGLDAQAAVHAMGISGSQASGILESFADGSWVKTFHAGWAAHAGIVSATLAANGFTGPPSVLEGRFGLFKSHVQRPDETLDMPALTRGLGIGWEIQSCSLKPYACAHVIHPYVDLALNLHERGVTGDKIAEIVAPIQPGYMPVVCEPRAAKVAPQTPTHARASLPYCIAAALVRGDLSLDAFAPDALKDADVLSLAARIMPQPDPTPTAPGQFRGALHVKLHDGTQMELGQNHNRGSAEHPLAPEEIAAKFRANVAQSLGPEQTRHILNACDALHMGGAVTDLIDLCLLADQQGQPSAPKPTIITPT
ncbi:MmgE/PrpD family protein [Roseibaca sp. V10]|uniref:MmgE/PrpD family protein n=1 Tax=Roseinatronobacter domitianus TaxID=2940293 RepID=A0ABT0M5S5_9RHOB|nr:MmgE/PrpD family protein [Roseibaca domitiana]MCL1630202.1 MmgE/PrpD family protein [Roseibaca domitiana]